MRFFEITLSIIAIVLPFFISTQKGRLSTNSLFAIISIALLLQATFEGFRWQIFPIYLVNLVLIFCLIKNYSFFKGNWLRKGMSFLTLFLLVGFSLLTATILPIFELPTPTGQYTVGSQYLHFVSEEEEEIITKDSADKRAFPIKVWYPAKVENEPKETYLNEGERTGFALKYGLPKNIFNYLDKVETHTFSKPAVASGKFPVLLFSHGYYSKASGYYALIEEIVSHGFIVLNLNHTYESAGALFPDGTIKLFDLAYDKQHNNQEMGEMSWNAMQAYQKANNQQEKLVAIENTLRNYVAVNITERWAKDIRMLVNELPNWETTTFLNQHIDTSKIGVFGHSQGGSAAGQALLEEQKIKAGISIDGVQWGKMIDTSFSKPFLHLTSDWPASHPDFNEHAYRNGSSEDFYQAKISNSGHSSFMDIPLMVNLKLINEAGSIEPQKALEITADIVITFFNKYLQKANVNLLNLKDQYPALLIEKREAVLKE
ncbi:MAG: hypothetical protein ACI87N_002845 [Flavobacteriales bacterium]|jgi:hypothetical protein